jgi:plasmid maintenance system antidote protein VapI
MNMNPRYSLRAFAAFLELQASKLSEILSGKKGLSLEKAQHVGRRLQLGPAEFEVFVLSVEAQHSRFPRRRAEALLQFEKLMRRNSQLAAKTEQKCAWYYGAVEACLERGQVDVAQMASKLGITSLQVENAKRYLARRAKNWPEKKQIRLEESNLLQKVQEAYVQGERHLEADAYFLQLSRDEQQELQGQIQNLIAEFKARVGRPEKSGGPTKSGSSDLDGANLQMININFISF